MPDRPYGPPGAPVMDIAVPLRYAATVRAFVRWLEAGVTGSVTYDRRGESIKATVQMTGAPERVMLAVPEAEDKPCPSP